MKINQQSILVRVLSVCLFLTACIFSIASFSSAAWAEDVTLAWDANSEDNLAGYKLYYKTDTGGVPYDGTGLNEGDSPVSIALENLSDAVSPAFTLTGLAEGTTYYFALTAFDTDGLESDYSDEVSYETAGAGTYSITAAASGQGSISPEGSVSVAEGETQTFTIAADANYHIAGVTVDGTSVGQVGTYTFENVTASHTITALFEIDTFTVTATAGENGSISPEGVTSAAYGTSLGYAITPADGYHIADVLVDGSSVGQVGAYSFENISTWHTIVASFEVDEVVIVDGGSSTDGEETVVEETTDNAAESTVEETTEETAEDLGTSSTQVDDNQAPETPVAVNDMIQSSAVGPVELAVGAFSDPDSGDTHMKTEWRAFRAEDEVCIFSIASTSSLTEFGVPEIMLEENSTYYWQARFFDNNNAASAWSEAAQFTTGFSDTDLDGDGITDDQEVDASVDMNEDGISDAEQEIIKSVVLPLSNESIGLSIENSDTATAILLMETIDVDSMSISETNKGRAKKLEFGLINFKISVAEPGDTATVTVYFPEAVHPLSKWMKLDVVNGVWLDYSGYSQLSEDRKSMTLELVDGGFGDDDGVANGIIIDPSGLELAVGEDELSSSSTEDVGVSADVGSELSGCFITGAYDAANLPMAAAGVLFLIAAAAVIAGGRRAGQRV